MGRPLTAEEAAAALRRGAQIEQFVGVESGVVRFLTAARRADRGEPPVFVVTLHVVEDVGHDGFCDLSEFPSVDPDEPDHEGPWMREYAEPADATACATLHGGHQGRWHPPGGAATTYASARKLADTL